VRERDVEAYFARRVKDLGGEVRKVKWVGRRGAPDRVAFFQGQTWWVELKAPGEIPEPHQIREHERMQAMGQSVFVIDSKDMVDTLLAPYCFSNQKTNCGGSGKYKPLELSHVSTDLEI
jgi:hypothetical protein